MTDKVSHVPFEKRISPPKLRHPLHNGLPGIGENRPPPRQPIQYSQQAAPQPKQVVQASQIEQQAQNEQLYYQEQMQMQGEQHQEPSMDVYRRAPRQVRDPNQPQYDSYNEMEGGYNHLEQYGGPGDLAQQSLPPGRGNSAFQQASRASLARYQRAPSGKTKGSEFYEKYFHQPSESHQRVLAEQKQDLVHSLQQQMIDKKERERQEKMQRDLEDMRAEEKYLADLRKAQELSSNEKKKPFNIFTEEPPAVETQIESRRPREPSRVMKEEASFQSHQVQRAPSESSKREQPPEEGRVVSLQVPGVEVQAFSASTGMPLANLAEPGGEGDSLALALQERGGQKDKWRDRVEGEAQNKVDQKKRELKMNTNLLYQQLVDLRVV